MVEKEKRDKKLKKDGRKESDEKKRKQSKSADREGEKSSGKRNKTEEFAHNNQQNARKSSNDSSKDGKKSKMKPEKGRQQKNQQKKGQESDTKKGPQQERAVWSKSKKKRMRQLKSKMRKETSKSATVESNKNQPIKEKKDDTTSTPNQSNNQPKKNASSKTGSSSLQKSYAARLVGSRFRILNEELYTTTSSTAYERFQSNPELFDQYHEGFRHQVEQWPSNPVDVIFDWLNKKYATSSKETVVVADFGCGDAELAKRLLEVRRHDNNKKTTETPKDCPFQVHSFDLIAQSDLVTACDMSNVPLPDKSVDVAVFCLALMGTNVADFLVEAHRVLKDNGKVKIAEVRSRFESSKKGKNNQLNDFVDKLKLLGFDCTNMDRSNKMFVLMELKKNGKVPDPTVDVQIKPCIYKRR